MNHLLWFSYPYLNWLKPWVSGFVPYLVGISIAIVFLDWYLPATNRIKGRLSMILLVVNALLIHNQLLPEKHWANIPLILAACITLLVYGIVFRKHLKDEWTTSPSHASMISGLLAILVITLIKLIELESWPPFLNEYAANTGVWGMAAVEGRWPIHPFQGRGFDLRGGGESPLMLPVLWSVMKLFGVSVWSVRFSEVIGSTLLLLIFWFWVRKTIPDRWSIIALAVFGLSPWHLAQSRMGTFFSTSVAVSLGLLWTTDSIWRNNESRIGIVKWIGFGFFAGCIGWSYAPLKVLYLFVGFIIFIVPALKRKIWKNWWPGPVCALIVFAVLLTLQLNILHGPIKMFQSQFGSLATDTPVWKKTVDDQVLSDLQPANVILKNILRNSVEWFRSTFAEQTIHRFYSGAFALSFIVALLCLILRWNPILAIYYFCGTLPPLLIFPLHRRTLIIWPLIYLVAVVVFREISVTGSALFQKPLFRRVIPTLVIGCLIGITLHGFNLWISTWSIVKDHSYFGPAKRLEAIHFADKIMDQQYVVFINPWVHDDIITITLYNRNKGLGGDAYNFVHVSEKSPVLSHLVNRKRTTSLIFFDLAKQEWLKKRLLEEIPGGVLQEFRNPVGRQELLYSVYTVPALN
ncbi:MAG: glycosyltransferase family 39 protein [bacterium]